MLLIAQEGVWQWQLGHLRPPPTRSITSPIFEDMVSSLICVQPAPICLRRSAIHSSCVISASTLPMSLMYLWCLSPSFFVLGFTLMGPAWLPLPNCRWAFPGPLLRVPGSWVVASGVSA
jgi:hypothetical protein